MEIASFFFVEKGGEYIDLFVQRSQPKFHAFVAAIRASHRVKDSVKEKSPDEERSRRKSVSLMRLLQLLLKKSIG